MEAAVKYNPEEHIKELEIRIQELKEAKDREYFARLEAEADARVSKNAFKALVREIANLPQQ